MPHCGRANSTERAGRLTGHHAEEPAAAPTAERKESGVVFSAGVPQDTFRIASHDLRRLVGLVTHDLGRFGASTVSFLFELSRDVAHVEASVYGDGGIECGDRIHSSTRTGQRKRLMKRFEAEVGSVEAHHDAIEDMHARIIAEPSRPGIRADTEPSA